jgi:hypothetical protein
MSFFLIALIAAVAGQIIGWAWFMPLFGKKWMWVVTDNQSQEMQYPMWVPLLINLIINYIFAFALFFVFGILGVPNLAAACIVGAIVLIGFALPMQIGAVLWNGKSWKKQLAGFGISFGFQIIYFVVMVLLFNWLA